MNFLNHPIEIWIIVFVAALVRVLTKVTMGFIAATLTVLIAVGAAVVMYQPVTHVLGLSPDPNTFVIVAASIALTFENIARNIVLRTEDPKALDRLAKAIWDRVVGRAPKD